MTQTPMRGLMQLPMRLLRGGLPLLLALAAAAPALAQEGMPSAGFSGQSLRPYQFVFLAYALAWLLVLGWVVAIARRLARVEKRLER